MNMTRHGPAFLDLRHVLLALEACSTAWPSPASADKVFFFFWGGLKLVQSPRVDECGAQMRHAGHALGSSLGLGAARLAGAPTCSPVLVHAQRQFPLS